MFYLFHHMAAYVRGCIIKLLIGSGRNCIGSGLRIYKGGTIRCRKNSSVILGSNVKLTEDAVLSAVNGGHLEIGRNVGIGCRNMIVCHESIVIGDNTTLAPNVLIYDHDHLFDKENGVRTREYKTQAVVIGKNCWIGAGTIILRGTTIEDNCVIGAGCVLKGHYAKGSVIVQKRETTVLGE